MAVRKTDPPASSLPGTEVTPPHLEQQRARGPIIQSRGLSDSVHPSAPESRRLAGGRAPADTYNRVPRRIRSDSAWSTQQLGNPILQSRVRVSLPAPPPLAVLVFPGGWSVSRNQARAPTRRAWLVNLLRPKRQSRNLWMSGPTPAQGRSYPPITHRPCQ